MGEDSLVILPKEKWSELKNIFKLDWPRCISAYNMLETQQKWSDMGIDYGFKVYCPFGVLKNGMVAVNPKDKLYEIVIQCPNDDTSELEDALRKTNKIDWNRMILIPFTPKHVIECIEKITKDMGKEMLLDPGESFYMDEMREPFKDISLPSNITFGHLTVDHVALVESKWPHRYKNAEWYFELLVNTKSGYGLFKDKELVAWVFHNDAGNMTHLYTMENHRRQGYAELLMKCMFRKMLIKNISVVCYCVKGNENAALLYKKMGMKTFPDIAWCAIKDNNTPVDMFVNVDILKSN